MAHKVVKILSYDDGEMEEHPVWCLVDPTNPGGPSTFCTKVFFGIGESKCEYREKEVTRGGITCNN